MWRFAFKAVLLVLIFLWQCRTVAAEEKAVAWKWTAGEELRYEVVISQLQRVTGWQQSTAMLRLQLEFSLTCERADDEGADILLRFENLTVRQREGLKSTDFNAAEPSAATSVWSMAWQMLKARDIAFSMTPRGGIVDMAGCGEILDGSLELLGQKALSRREFFTLQQHFSCRNISNLLVKVFDVMPEEPVPVGAGWRRDMHMELPMIGMVRRFNTIKLDHFKKDAASGYELAFLTAAGGLQMLDRQSAEIELAEGVLFVDVKHASLTSEAIIDITRGKVDQHIIEGTMRVVTEIEQKAGSDDEVDVKQSINQHLEHQLKLRRL